MRRIEYIDLAIDLYENRGDNYVFEAHRLIGGPFSLQHIVAITGVPARHLRDAYAEHTRPGGRFRPKSLKDMGQLRHLLELGAELDKGLVWKVVLAGTSTRVLANIIGVSVTEVNNLMREGINEVSVPGHGDAQRGDTMGA